MPEIDRYKPEDRRGIEALTRRTLGADAAEADRLTWDWRYRRNPFRRIRASLWVAREGPTIVGYLPTMPVRLSVKGSRWTPPGPRSRAWRPSASSRATTRR
jgi:hypothetical protein